MNDMSRDGGSFRDPSGYVFYRDGRVLRAVTERARAAYESVRANPVVAELIERGDIIGSRELPAPEAAALAPGAAYVVEHDRVPFVSYPYEWPFALLKRAARFHLGLQIRLLEADIMLSDATAYNIQFLGPRPVFIDYLSLRPYRDGELWMGHHQFMQQFLHPLLLNAGAGISFNNWYKGNLDGIRRAELLRALPLRARMSRRVFSQITLPQMIETEQRATNTTSGGKSAARLEKSVLIKMLHGLDSWISDLEAKTVTGTTWADYQKTRTYNSEEVDQKQDAVTDFVRAHAPGTIWDIGCNTGEFSEIALAAGCGRVIGFDLDEGALHLACERAETKGLDLLPLTMDLLNPSPGCGWDGGERKRLTDRSRPDAIIALAVIHHLAIAGNIPLGEAVRWLVSLAPKGVIEFVQKSDETVQRMLRFREDIFEGYDETLFRANLDEYAKVLDRQEVSRAGRILYFYSRR